MTTPRLGLGELLTGQNGNEVRVNTALRRLESMLQARVESRVTSTPPGSPANGDMYIPLYPATGAWTGHDGGDEFAYCENGGWLFQLIPTGATMYIVDEAKGFMWDGAALFEIAVGGGGGGVSDGATLVTGLTFPNTGVHVLDTDASHDLILKPGSNLTADRTLSILTGDANRDLTISGNTTLGGGSHSGTNTGDQTISLTGDVTGSGTGSFAATIANDAVTYAKMQNVSATNKILGRSTAGPGDVEEIDCTAAGRALIDDATAADQRTTLGLGALATLNRGYSFACAQRALMV